MILNNNITEEAFLRAFPRPYVVRALSPWEAAAEGRSLDRTWWRFVREFTYVSDRWGPITQWEGNTTDFGSVPLKLRSIYDDDSPIMLYPSGPHDLLFQQRADGTRGWLADGRQLTLRQANEVMMEAMWYCGASETERSHVGAALRVGNLPLKSQFAKEAAV